MPLGILDIPRYPNVPTAPGIPPVLRQVGTVINAISLLASDAKVIVSLFAGAKRWGLFSNGGLVPVLTSSSVLAVDYRREHSISVAPLESGTFAAYDKVAQPYDIRLTLAFNGLPSLLQSLNPLAAIGSLLGSPSPNAQRRSEALAVLETLTDSLDLYWVVTPEHVYRSCNIRHIDYRRDGRRGPTAIEVDVWLTEIRYASAIVQPKPPSSAGAQSGTATATPDGTSPVDSGVLQTQPL